jgi:hypothetical protein
MAERMKQCDYDIPEYLQLDTRIVLEKVSSLPAYEIQFEISELLIIIVPLSVCDRKLPITIQAYLGYYVASKLHFFTPGPIQGISCRGGYYLAVRCLPLNITNIYFILREWVHQYNGRGWGAIDLVYHGSPLLGLGQRQACMDQWQ